MTSTEKDDLAVSLRQYAELLVSELAKRTDDKFLAAKEAVGTAMVAAEKGISAALLAQDKLTQQAFTSAKEALKEAQIQLAEYKAASNEWRDTLTDLIAKGMLRPEVEALFKASNEKFELVVERLGKIESKLSASEGVAKGKGDFAGYIVAAVSIIYGIIMTIMVFFRH
jgi:hypothetical protein